MKTQSPQPPKHISERQTIIERIDNNSKIKESYFRIDYNATATIDEVIESLANIKAWLKKNSGKVQYDKVWVEIEEYEEDEFGHLGNRVVVKGRRQENDEEYANRMEREKVLCKHKYYQHQLENDYWQSKDGLSEMAWFNSKGK